jgi:hypothetical protein
MNINKQSKRESFIRKLVPRLHLFLQKKILQVIQIHISKFSSYLCQIRNQHSLKVINEKKDFEFELLVSTLVKTKSITSTSYFDFL